MKTKIEIKSILGNLLFESEEEDNTLKKTLELAVSSGADLSGADLSGANLYRANLYRADLSGADLSGANLYRADLSGANLYGADLSGANLYRADLSGYISVGPIGSRKSYLWAMWENKKYIVHTGCFTGTLAEFSKAVKQKYKDGIHLNEYTLAIKLLEKRMEETKTNE